MKLKGLNICSFYPFDDFGLPKGTRYRQHNNPFILFNKIDGTSLKAYYQFEEASGNLINNANLVTNNSTLGSAVDGTNTSVTYSQSGIIGNSYKYPIVSSAHTVLGSTPSNWTFLHYDATAIKWTIAFWFKSVANPTTTETLFDNNTDGDTTLTGISIFRSSANAINVIINRASSGTHVISTNTANNYIPNDTNWHFIVITYDQSLASNNLTIMLDNANTFNASKSGSAPSSTAPSFNLTIGSSASAASLPMNAFMDELSIWARVLTSAEQTSLYNGGSGKSLY